MAKGENLDPAILASFQANLQRRDNGIIILTYDEINEVFPILDNAEFADDVAAKEKELRETIPNDPKIEDKLAALVQNLRSKEMNHIIEHSQITIAWDHGKYRKDKTLISLEEEVKPGPELRGNQFVIRHDISLKQNREQSSSYDGRQVRMLTRGDDVRSRSLLLGTGTPDSLAKEVMSTGTVPSEIVKFLDSATIDIQTDSANITLLHAVRGQLDIELRFASKYQNAILSSRITDLVGGRRDVMQASEMKLIDQIWYPQVVVFDVNRINKLGQQKLISHKVRRLISGTFNGRIENKDSFFSLLDDKPVTVTDFNFSPALSYSTENGTELDSRITDAATASANDLVELQGHKVISDSASINPPPAGSLLRNIFIATGVILATLGGIIYYKSKMNRRV